MSIYANFFAILCLMQGACVLILALGELARRRTRLPALKINQIRLEIEAGMAKHYRDQFSSPERSAIIENQLRTLLEFGNLESYK